MTSKRHTVDAEKNILRQLRRSGKINKFNPVLKCLIKGLCDEECVLSKLQGTLHIVENIWARVTEHWKNSIRSENQSGENKEEEDDFTLTTRDFGLLRMDCRKNLCFPPPKDIWVTMMPFVMSKTFKESKLPTYLKPYWNSLIDKDYWTKDSSCMKLISNREVGKIGYLTVHESYVEKGNVQDKKGVRTRRPGKIRLVARNDRKCDHGDQKKKNKADCCCDVISPDVGGGDVVEGRFMSERKVTLINGMYVASNVATTKAWNCRVASHDDTYDVIGESGNVEHLREFFPSSVGGCNGSEKLKGNQMHWLTDRTPYQLVPLKHGAYVQHFCMVTSEVSVWYDGEWTHNPLGVKPRSTKTKILVRSQMSKKKNTNRVDGFKVLWM